MKKSTIWLLAVVMAFAFAGLLYLQINYVDIILKTRSEQFDETVKQCLHQVSKNLELDETRQYLEDDINRDQNSFLYQNVIITDSDGGVQQIELQSFSSPKFQPRSSLSNQQTNSIVNTSRDLQKTLKQRYQYQGGLIDEVIYNILYTANLKPIQERVNFKKLNSYLKNEFINSGLNLPFVFSVINKDGNEVYRSGKIDGEPLASDIITQVLFPNDPPSKQNYLKVYFPTKGDYISNSITFIVPSVIFSMILLITFIFTIYIVFRQKRLSEMKNDFINNMTHELKTDLDLDALDSTIYVDEMHITNVLFNLMDNAVKYRRQDVPLALLVRTWNENGKLHISVEDNGIGIKKEYLKKVFDRFFRVPTGNKHDVKGFGLGLAYVRKIIEDHKGSIRAEQGNNNIGTKFIITLPLIKS